jgi:predicted transcriptional regulator
MSNRITVRLTGDLADWLSEMARKKGVTPSQIIRELLEKARSAEERSFMRLAGAADGPADLSKRRGFSNR